MALVGWKYYSEITISNPNNTVLTDYQVKIDLDNSNFDFSKANNDGSDIRFSEDYGNTTIPYWIESWDGANQKAIIWVKISSIDANGSKTIRMYYGNPNAISESNGDNVFEFFDDGNQISNWTIAGSAGQDPNLGNLAPSYYAVGSNGSYMYRDIGLTPYSVIEFDVYSSTLGDLFFLTDINGKGQYIRLDTRSNWPCGFGPTSSWTSWGDTSGNLHVSANTWHHAKLVIGNTTAYAYIDEQDVGSSYNFTNNGSFIGLVGDGGGGQTNWDNIFVRKYADSEPTYTIGSTVIVTSKLSGTVCDKFGNPITGKTVDIAFFNKDTKELLHTTQSNSSDGSWVDDQIPVPENTKIIAVFTLEDTYNGDTDIAGAEFTITQTKD